MGTKDAAPVVKTGLADALFPSTKQKVLGLLFGQPRRSFYAKELIGLVASGSGAVQRELATLADSGLVTVKVIGKQKHYQANPNSPIFSELCAMVQKTTGLAGPLRDALEPVAKKVAAAFVYGSVAKKTDHAGSDIDLMLISDDIGYGELFTTLEAAQTKLGRPVNPTILTYKELHRRLAEKESF
ncbi:MAG TPA: nucleotidyltransferase domain-containing protein, partial [Burkholderiaceae bacterium]|nr:nucleotidyltransferase domain-containing protein [Burkholderiaceae bacterium]